MQGACHEATLPADTFRLFRAIGSHSRLRVRWDANTFSRRFDTSLIYAPRFARTCESICSTLNLSAPCMNASLIELLRYTTIIEKYFIRIRLESIVVSMDRPFEMDRVDGGVKRASAPSSRSKSIGDEDAFELAQVGKRQILKVREKSQ